MRTSMKLAYLETDVSVDARREAVGSEGGFFTAGTGIISSGTFAFGLSSQSQSLWGAFEVRSMPSTAPSCTGSQKPRSLEFDGCGPRRIINSSRRLSTVGRRTSP
jgi:hypothetical protein